MKKIAFTLTNEEKLNKAIETGTIGKVEPDFLKECEIEIPDFIIGVGIIGAIDDYIENNKLNGWKLATYQHISVEEVK